MSLVALSGRNGFIGSYLAKYLENLGHGVIPIPRDLLYFPEALKKYFREKNPEYIIHAAAYGNMGSHTNYDMIYKANIDALYNLLTASKDLPYKRLINLSSSSVYGETRNVMSESDQIFPKTPYATTKAAGELIVNGFREHYGKDIITVRPFSVYGDGEADFRFIPMMIKLIKNGQPITLYEGNHDWIYIDDFVRALVMIMVGNTQEDTYNIGTGIQTSNRKVVRQISAIIGKPAVIEKEEPMKSQDSRVWVANITRLILLGFVPNYTLFDGLVRTIRYYDK